MTSIDVDVLIGVDALAHRLSAVEPPALLDVRWALGDPHGADHYRAGHIPGAVYVDLDAELAGPPSARGGRHPLPAVSDLERNARAWGLREGQMVVVYDDNSGLGAGRAWWLLRWAGIADVRILDGGLAAWRGAGRNAEAGDVRPARGDVSLRGGALPVLDADAAAALPSQGILVDARAVERYRGEVEPLDPRAGHIPGAISLPTTENVDADGRFLQADELQTRFELAGVVADGGTVGVYCGSGVTAAHELAALRIAGIDAVLYPGSWSEWSADPLRPVATAVDAARAAPLEVEQATARPDRPRVDEVVRTCRSSS